MLKKTTTVFVEKIFFNDFLSIPSLDLAFPKESQDQNKKLNYTLNMANPTKKLLLAIPIQFEELDGMPEMMKKLKIFSDKRSYPIKWVPPENFHLSLHLLENLEEKELNLIENKVAKLAKKTPKFQIEVKNTGAFPSVEKGRVLWLGIRESRDLMNFQREIQDLCEELLPEKKIEFSHAYRPHISLGRLRSTKHLGSLLQPFLRKQFGKKEISEICLFESVLQNRMPVYKKLTSFPLK